jgi:hypothetical protein
MDQTFVILFSGLYALLSGDPGAPSVPAAHVLLVDAQKHPALGLPRHSPVLTVPYSDVVPMSAAADVTVVLPDGSAYSVWNLDHQTLTISGDLAGPERITEARDRRLRGSVTPAAGTNQAEDTSWVARMSALGVDATLDPAVFGSPERSALAARVDLRRGTLSTQSLLGEKENPLTFAFRRGGRGDDPPVLTQALADVVRYAEPLSGEGVVKITLTPWAKKAPVRTIELRCTTGPVVATISNQPTTKHEAHTDDVVMTHYSAFYDLLKTKPTADRRPLPVAQRKLTEKECKTLQTSHCAPGGFP